ncbi:MAG: hypothetical protein R6X33_19105 [Candidatus Brocadiia bacterium]
MDAEDVDADDTPRRLPGLWVICVLFGLSGMTTLSLVFLATPAGMALFGGLAVAHLVLAVGLWRRSRWAWGGALGLLGLGLIYWGGTALTNWPDGAGAAALPVAVTLGIMAYLWFRRQHFREGASRAPYGTVRAAVAAGMVLFWGVALTLWATVDDPRRDFPALQVDTAPPPPGENAFFVIERMRAIAPEEKEVTDEDGQWGTNGANELSFLLEHAPGRGGPVPEDWEVRAERLLAAHAEVLELVDDALAHGQLSQPGPPTGIEATEAAMPWLEFSRRTGRLLSLSCELHLLRAETEAAMEDADRGVRLGLLYLRRPDALVDHLVGMSIYKGSLWQLREVVARTRDVSILREYSLNGAPEKELRAGVRHALASEFHRMMKIVEDLHESTIPEVQALAAGEEGPEGGTQFIRRVPFVKPGMTHNLAGRFFSSLVEETQRYDPPVPDPEWQAYGVRELADTVGWIHVVRNPIGDVILAMTFPACARAVEMHFEAVAAFRLTRIHLALRTHQLEHGEMPEVLDALAPEYLDEVPVDPFTREPFVYEPDADPPHVRSAGPDRERGKSRMEGGDDIVVELGFAGERE